MDSTLDQIQVDDAFLVYDDPEGFLPSLNPLQFDYQSYPKNKGFNIKSKLIMLPL
ncbi:MAG: hypothetical protein NXH90_14350 [Flavobacteriaceae bacterium]|nr:hypothetical protein [Flavobacteriaceae bacterium]